MIGPKPKQPAWDSVASEKEGKRKKKKKLGAGGSALLGKLSELCASTKSHPSTHLFSHSFIFADINCTNNTLWPEFISMAAHKCNFQRKHFAPHTGMAVTQEHPFHYFFNYRSQKTIPLSLVGPAASLRLHSKLCALQSSTSAFTRNQLCSLVAASNVQLY